MQHDGFIAQETSSEAARLGEYRILGVGIVADHAPHIVILTVVKPAINGVALTSIADRFHILLRPVDKKPSVRGDPELDIKGMNPAETAAGNDQNRRVPLCAVVTVCKDIEIIRMRLGVSAGVPAGKDASAACNRHRGNPLEKPDLKLRYPYDLQ